MRAAFVMAWRTLLRGRFLPLLLLGSVAVVLLMPGIIRTDGTVDGARELYIRSVLGCVAALVFVSILCASCGHLARSRESHRLSLAVIRPMGAFRAMVGVWCAYAAAAAIVLSVAAAAVCLRAPGGAVPCRHHIAPVLPPPMSVAMGKIDGFLEDPSTPPAMRKVPRKAVLAFLAASEADRYDSVPPGESARWDFPARWAGADDLRLKVRFSAQFAVRMPFVGEFSFGDAHASVSNDTQAVLELPLVRRAGSASASSASAGNAAQTTVAAEFRNAGRGAVMLRPRQDLFLLAPADSFAANLIRAVVHSLSGVALAAAFGLFLSSTLSRPVAVFTAFVAAAVIFLAPDVLDQFPDGTGLPLGDRIGIALSRGVYAVTSSLSEASPIADLAENRCVEWSALARAVIVNAVLLPAAFLGLASFAVRRKALADNG